MRLENPMLLAVKMFLAEVRPWRRTYRFPDYVCVDFTLEAFYTATLRGMRCGYAIITFEDMQTAHAILAFDTDFGLVYIEPQSGNQEKITIGKPYPTNLEGVPEGCPISGVQISWNDEQEFRFLECPDCGYLVLAQCPDCGCASLEFMKVEG